MKKLKLFASVLFAAVCLLSCSKSKDSTPTPANSKEFDLSIKLTFTNFDPTKDVLAGGLEGSTVTDTYSDWTINGTERKGENAFVFDNTYVVNNVTSISTNAKINHASITIGGAAPQGAPYTVTVQATKNGKALDPVTIQITGASTVRSIEYTTDN